MSTWTATGPEDAGDHFGDDQCGVAEVLTFTNPTHPNAIVSVYFGVQKFQQGRRYSAVSSVEMALLNPTTREEENAHTFSQDDLFPHDHDRMVMASRDMTNEIDHWRDNTFHGNILGFDGITLPPHQ